MVLSYLLAIVLNTFGDRLRGGGFIKSDNRILSAGLMGGLVFTTCMYLLIPLTQWEAFGILVAYLIGESWGWGEPLGAFLRRSRMRVSKYEWWQVSILQDYPALALTVRGAMWSVPLVIVLYFISPWVALGTFIAYTTGMVVAPFMAREAIPDKTAWDMWKFQEYIRGGWVMAIIGMFTYTM